MNKKSRSIIKNLFVFLFAIIMIYPVIWLFLSSFKANNEIFNATSILPKKWLWENYLHGWFAIPKNSFAVFFFNSFKICFIVVIGSVVSNSLIAYPFARLEFPFKNVLFAIMMGTLMLPAQVLLIPRYLIFTKIGWTNSILPLTVPSFFGSAFFIYLMIQFLRGIPKELDEAAIVDGCSHAGIFFRVLLPNCKPALVTIALFSFTWNWDAFQDQLIYLNRIGDYTVSLALRLFMDNTAQVNWGSLFAMSFLSIIPSFIIFFMGQKHFVEGIATTGLK